MVTSKIKSGQKKGKVKVGKLKLNKETVKDLTDSERKQIKGGQISNCSCQEAFRSACIVKQ